MEFERKRYFHVRGCDTGYKYRINYASGPFNVDRLDRLDAPVETYCFGPRGILWPGDIMLDQKIALETDETRTIKKIANARNVWMPWAALQAVVGNIVSVRATS